MFSKLAGNEEVKRTLLRQIAADRVPNSMIFAGDEGVGKRQFAFELARTLLCPDSRDHGACGVCVVCRRSGAIELPSRDDKNKDEFKKVIFGGHTDVGTVSAFRRLILVDAIRDLERHANFRPHEGKSRFFIVDDAHTMNDAASNALLKTLEEPASTSYIFLITSRADSLLPTIRSRCQMLRFAPVETETVEKYLIEERAFSHDEARLAASLSRGSIGRAVSINVEQFRAQRDRMLSVIVSAIETGDRAAMFRVAEEMNDAKNKDKFEENLSILESLIHDVWSLRITGDASRLVNTDLAERLTRLASEVRHSDLPGWLDEIATVRDNLTVNINRKIAADSLFVLMAGA
ncbi:MAG: DNA polymerase III subunit delta' [Pyrinomonadaceae bacterium]